MLGIEDAGEVFEEVLAVLEEVTELGVAEANAAA